MTAASLSKAVFFEWFYNPAQQEYFELPTRIERIIRQSYFGGRTEVGWQGRVDGKIYMYDITSLYPWASTFDLPAGRPLPLDSIDVTERIANRTFFGFVIAKVRSVPSDTYFRPLHGCRANQRLVFPVFNEWTPIVLFSEEIYKAQDYGHFYEYEFQEGFHFERYPILKEFMLTMTRKKAMADAEGDEVGRTMFKLIANTGYGWWAIRTDNKTCVNIYPAQKNMVAKHFVRNELINYCTRGDYQIIRTQQDLPIRNSNVGVAAAITSYARMRMHDILYSMEQKGIRVFYWDTDSVACDADLSQYPDLMQKFAWDGMNDFRKMGAELGSLKNEAQSIWTKNQIPVTEMPYFDRAVFLLPKLYMLEKVLPDGRTYQKGASKGISRKQPVLLKAADQSLWDNGKQIGWVQNGRAVDVERQPMVLNSSVCNENGHCIDLKGNVQLD
jgi:hypothetical protein